MGHVERERCPFFKGIRVGNPKQKMHEEKIRGQKAAKQSFSSHLFCSITHERERWRDERRETQRGIHARGHARTHAHTHTHTHTHRVFKKRVRERERARERLTLFSFFCVTDELIQKREREEL